MKKDLFAVLVAGTLLLVASVALAHDLLLKLDTYFLEPRTRVRVTVLNGTFAKSGGFVAPDRVADISVVAPGGRTRLRHPVRRHEPAQSSTRCPRHVRGRRL